MGLLRTALIGGIAYKMGSSGNSDKQNNNSSNYSPPPPPQQYYYGGYPPQQYGQPPYGAPTYPPPGPPYDPRYGGYNYQGQGQGYGGYSANGGYAPPQQSSRGIQDPYANTSGPSQNAPPPYQQDPAQQNYQGYQDHNEKLPAYHQGQGYQPPRQK
ncbi:hypothetical protein N7540_000865 [Penicillium herquei]|nr:hypothetical protein N7540_000865 [Penicillium herquei]